MLQVQAPVFSTQYIFTIVAMRVVVVMIVMGRDDDVTVPPCKALPPVLFHCFWFMLWNRRQESTPESQVSWLPAITFPLLSASSWGNFQGGGRRRRDTLSNQRTNSDSAEIHYGSIHCSSQSGENLFVGENRTQRIIPIPVSYREKVEGSLGDSCLF